MNFPQQNPSPFPVNTNNPMCFNTGFYFNDVPNNIHFNMYKQEQLTNTCQYPTYPNVIRNEFIKDDLNVNEFLNNYNNLNNINKQKRINIQKIRNPVNAIKGTHSNNNSFYPNGTVNPQNFKASNLKKPKNEYYADNMSFDINLKHTDILSTKSATNKSHAFKNDVIVNSDRKPNLMPPAMEFLSNFNENPHLIKKQIHSNKNISKQSENKYSLNFHGNNTNENENSLIAIPQNFRKQTATGFPLNSLNNSINHSGDNHVSLHYGHIPPILETLNLTNNNNHQHFYAHNLSDAVIDKTEFLIEFADFNNFNINKSKDNYFKDFESSKNNNNTKKLNQQQNEKKTKNTKNIDEAKAAEEKKNINFNDFKDILAENHIANKKGNLLAFSKKLSTVEEKKDGKSLIQNNYQVTIINGYNLNDNSEINKNFNLEEKLLKHLRDNKNFNIINSINNSNEKVNSADLTEKKVASPVRSQINSSKNKEFLNYLEDSELSIIKPSKEENLKNEDFSSNKFINFNDLKDNEFFDLNKTMKTNSHDKIPSITSDYFAYKFTSGGESLKIDLNFDKMLYQSTRQRNKHKGGLFISIEEDEFKNKIENNSKRQEEIEMRHRLHVHKGGCGSGSYIYMSPNENLNETFDKEFGDGYGPQKSMFIIIFSYLQKYLNLKFRNAEDK